MLPAKKYMVPALGVTIIALGVYLTWTLPDGMLFPIVCLWASVVGFCVVLPYMAFRRQKQNRGRIGMIHDYEAPAGLSADEQQRFRARRASQGMITVVLLLAFLVVVAWRVLKLRH